MRRNCEIGRSCISFTQHNSSSMPPSGNARFLSIFDPHVKVLMHIWVERMQSLNNEKSELSTLLSGQDMLQEVTNQVFKDLGSYAPDVSALPEQLSAEWLINCCEGIITQLFRKHYSDLLSIMYRADVKETMYREVISEFESSELKTVQKLTLLLLNRELMKVLTRKAYTTTQKSSD